MCSSDLSRLENGNSSVSKSPQNLVGCYVNSAGILGASPEWQIGSISRNSSGYFWTNAAGISWGLTFDGTNLETDQRNPYYENGHKFILNMGEVKQAPIPNTSISATSTSVSANKDLPSTSKTPLAVSSKSGSSSTKTSSSSISKSSKMVRYICVKGTKQLVFIAKTRGCPNGYKLKP